MGINLLTTVAGILRTISSPFSDCVWTNKILYRGKCRLFYYCGSHNSSSYFSTPLLHSGRNVLITILIDGNLFTTVIAVVRVASAPYDDCVWTNEVRLRLIAVNLSDAVIVITGTASVMISNVRLTVPVIIDLFYYCDRHISDSHCSLQ